MVVVPASFLGDREVAQYAQAFLLYEQTGDLLPVLQLIQHPRHSQFLPILLVSRVKGVVFRFDLLVTYHVDSGSAEEFDVPFVTFLIHVCRGEHPVSKTVRTKILLSYPAEPFPWVTSCCPTP
ncbi:hypothetical protein D9M68_954080 [compost metagenome]